jgi:hypothetical protein
LTSYGSGDHARLVSDMKEQQNSRFHTLSMGLPMHASM